MLVRGCTGLSESHVHQHRCHVWWSPTNSVWRAVTAECHRQSSAAMAAALAIAIAHNNLTTYYFDSYCSFALISIMVCLTSKAHHIKGHIMFPGYIMSHSKSYTLPKIAGASSMNSLMSGTEMIGSE